MDRPYPDILICNQFVPSSAIKPAVAVGSTEQFRRSDASTHLPWRYLSWRHQRSPSSGARPALEVTSFKYEVHGQYEAYEGSHVVPMQTLSVKHKADDGREDGE